MASTSRLTLPALLHFGKGEPVFFIRKGSIIRQINSDVDGVLIGVIRGAGFGGSGSGICGRLAALEATAEEPLLPQAAKVPAAMQVAKAMAKVRLTDFFMGYPP